MNKPHEHNANLRAWSEREGQTYGDMFRAMERDAAEQRECPMCAALAAETRKP